MKSILRTWSAVLLVLVPAAEASGASSPEGDSDLDAARHLFEKNVAAVRSHDAASYLDCFLESDDLVRAGRRGTSRGFEPLAEAVGEGKWPDLYEVLDRRLVSLRPGTVFATFRYRLRLGGREDTGRGEHLFVETEDGWRIAMSSNYPALPGTTPPARVLRGATLVDGTGAPPLEDAVVVTRDGRVECAGKICVVPDGADTVDLDGMWIVPGLVDAHVHLSATGWADGFPGVLDLGDSYPYARVAAGLRSSPERWFQAYLCSGVTSVLDAGGYAFTVEHRERARRSLLAPNVAVTGPLLATYDLGFGVPSERMMIYLADEDAARHGVEYLDALGTDAVKLHFMPAERDFAELEPIVRALGKEAARREMRVVAHATGAREARIAVEAGVRVLLHSVFPPHSPQGDGVMDQEIDDGLIALMQSRDVIYVPTLTVFRAGASLHRILETGAVPEIDDPNGCLDELTVAKLLSTPDWQPGPLGPRAPEGGDRVRVAAANLIRVHAAGVSVAVGTDAGATMVPHGPSIYAEMEAMQAAGLTPMDVLVAATRGSAQALGREDVIGTLTPGKIADLLVVAADPTADIAHLRQLRYVMRGGELRAAEELRARPGGVSSSNGVKVEIGSP